MAAAAFVIVILRTVGIKGLVSLSALITWSAIPTPGLISRFSGPIFVDANFFEVAIFLAFFVLMTLILLRQKEVTNSPYWPLFALFAVFGLIGFLIGYDPDRLLAWRQFRQTCVAPFALYFLVTQFVDDSKDAKRAATCILMSGFLICLFPITGFREVPAASLSIQDLLDERLSGSYDLGPLGLLSLNLNSGSFFLGLFVILGLCLFLSNSSKSLKLLAGMVVVTGTSGVVGMATRGTWLSMLVVVPVICLLNIKYAGIKSRQIVFPVSLAICVVAVLLIKGSLVSGEAVSRWESMQSIESIRNDANFEGRIQVNQEAFQIWLENPMGTGFIYLVPRLGSAIHCLYFDYLLGTGLAGLVVFMILMTLLFLYCLKALRCAAREDAWLLIATMAAILFLMIFGFTGSFSKRFYVYITFWTIVSLGVVTARFALAKQALETAIASQAGSMS